eukprot:scaffold126648_cov31-Tisochrysis_lutea.AAC.7
MVPGPASGRVTCLPLLRVGIQASTKGLSSACALWTHSRIVDMRRGHPKTSWTVGAPAAMSSVLSIPSPR